MTDWIPVTERLPEEEEEAECDYCSTIIPDNSPIHFVNPEFEDPRLGDYICQGCFDGTSDYMQQIKEECKKYFKLQVRSSEKGD